MFELSLLWQHKTFLLAGAVVTIKLTAGAVVLGLTLGILFGMGRISGNRLIRTISSVYVQVLRGTPMLLQIFFVFFGIPQIYHAVLGANMSPDPLVAGTIALGVNSGAYVAEIVRAGIQSIHQGKVEVGRSLGLSYWLIMRLIILPQAIKRIIPPLCNEAIVLLKDSSLVSVIGASELMYSARVMGARYYDYVQFLFGAAMIYLCLTFFIAQVLAMLERRMETA